MFKIVALMTLIGVSNPDIRIPHEVFYNQQTFDSKEQCTMFLEENDKLLMDTLAYYLMMTPQFKGYVAEIHELECSEYSEHHKNEGELLET